MNEYLPWQAIQTDINWILNCPPLLTPNTHLWQPNWLNIKQNQLVEEKIRQAVPTRDGKLGRYFEQLAGALFLISDRYQILAQNRVIQGEAQTLGELDLLVKDLPTGDIIHIELALKFYLYAPAAGDLSSGWVGAGLHDFMAAKIDRLFFHQLQLPQKALSQGCWPDDLPLPSKHFLWMPGRLFFSASTPDAKTAESVLLNTQFGETPWSLNPGALTGQWFEEDHIDIGGNLPLAKVDWLLGKPIAPGRNALPAQFCLPTHNKPVYVLPKQWQNTAIAAIDQYNEKK